MSKLRRFFILLASIVTILIGVVILLNPKETSYVIVCIILGVVITYKGLKTLFFYISSARHMVGGTRIFVNSIIYLDLGSISLFLLLESPFLGMLYIVSLFMLLGVIDVLRALEIKRNEGKLWWLKLCKGIIVICIAIFCFIFATSESLMLLIVGIGWIIYGVEGIAQTFTKSSVIYIEPSD